MTDQSEMDDIPFEDDTTSAAQQDGTAVTHAETRKIQTNNSYLKALNEAQQKAVQITEGPVLVLAGAGTGKTRVLVTRIGHILNLELAKPWEILAVTFTNKAAREMEHRISQLASNAVEGMWLGTFHSISVRILRNHAELVGLKSNFTIIDADDQIRVLKQIMQANNIDEKRWPARVLASIINRWKDRGLGPNKIGDEDVSGFALGKATRLYAEYNERLRIQNAADFGDLLLHCIDILRTQKDILANYHRRFRYILVDEYQDTNVAQYLWLKLLAQGQKNICCVGDDDQSIYGWRGADVGNILRFESDFEGSQVIRLEQNYRSQPHILAAASQLIKNNKDRLGKTLWTNRPEEDKIKIVSFWDGEDEARTLVQECENLKNTNCSLNEIAILVRAGFQTREFEDQFLASGLPYRVIGGPRFYERREIRDAIAYLRVIAQPDDGIAFERIINVPKRGLGNITIQAIHKLARESGQSMLAAAQALIGTDELRQQACTALSKLIESFNRWRAIAEKLEITELLKIVLDESSYTEMWQRDKSIEAPGRLDNLRELIDTVENFENLTSFLDHVSLVMENDSKDNSEMVSIMTLHAAKGLEFDTVLLPGWEEGLIPNQRAMDENGKSALEEERRLAHVGLTRAKKKVLISFARSRRTFGEWQNTLPSRFIDELPPENIQISENSPIWNQSAFILDEFNQDNGNENNPYTTSRLDAYGQQRVRYKRKINRDGLIIDAEGSEHHQMLDTENGNNLKNGDRIFHKKFGYGKIINIDGNKLDIAFEKAGQKKVIDAFVKLV